MPFLDYKITHLTEDLVSLDDLRRFINETNAKRKLMGLTELCFKAEQLYEAG